MHTFAYSLSIVSLLYLYRELSRLMRRSLGIMKITSPFPSVHTHAFIYLCVLYEREAVHCDYIDDDNSAIMADCMFSLRSHVSPFKETHFSHSWITSFSFFVSSKIKMLSLGCML